MRSPSFDERGERLGMLSAAARLCEDGQARAPREPSMRALTLRPIRPEDEPALQAFVLRQSPEDRRLRFFSQVKELNHQLAARLTQIDYDREMALIALSEGAVLGIARFFADPDRLKAEYAIAVRTDWHGRGVGYLLMRRLIEVARKWGIAELVGEVLRDNQPMLAMCREFGFAVTPNADDTSIMQVTRKLEPS